MQASVARRVGLVVTLVGSAIYVGSAGKSDHRVATVAAMLIILVGLLFILFHGLRNIDRNLLESTAPAGEGSNIRDVGTGSRLRGKFGHRKTLRLLPHFPLIAITGMMIVLVVFMSFGPLPSRGLWVFFGQELFTRAHADPAGPVVVQIRTAAKSDSHAPSRVFVNQREVDWANLRGALLSQLSTRADWVVFIDADASLPYAEPVKVVDVANQLMAKPVLVTRNMLQPQPAGHDSRYLRSQPVWVFRAIAEHN